MLRWIIFIIIFTLIDFYAFQGFKAVSKHKSIWWAYWLFSLFVICNVIYQINTDDRTNGMSHGLMWSFGLMILSVVPKLLVLLVMFGEDVYRLAKLAIDYFRGEPLEMASRRAFLGKVALGVAAIPFASILYGMTRGKYNYQIVKHTLFFDDLPEAFDGYQLTHISDVHSGSFDNAEKINHGMDLINQQESDLILFTGDIVNNVAEEMEPWIPYFAKLKAKDGKYSVLGNHDYGEYVRWEKPGQKEQNFENIKGIHPKIGFNLLLNDSVHIQRGDEKIALVGVENWGTRFKKAGDLNIASEKVSNDDFKILMSHDPSHWDKEVKLHSNKYHLTLSGHTHGMQFGIEIPGIRWSPVQYVYKQWAGIYENAGRFINVNRGFGFLAFPGRVGIWPEISVITLKKKR
ncbi:metallophosphoesterase [Urechidicola sp. KH5]